MCPDKETTQISANILQISGHKSHLLHCWKKSLSISICIATASYSSRRVSHHLFNITDDGKRSCSPNTSPLQQKPRKEWERELGRDVSQESHQPYPWYYVYSNEDEHVCCGGVLYFQYANGCFILSHFLLSKAAKCLFPKTKTKEQTHPILNAQR